VPIGRREEGREDNRGRRRLSTSRRRRLSDWTCLTRAAFRLFLSCYGEALATRANGDTEVKTAPNERQPGGATEPGRRRGHGHHQKEDGVAHRPEHVIEITDLAQMIPAEEQAQRQAPADLLPSRCCRRRRPPEIAHAGPTAHAGAAAGWLRRETGWRLRRRRGAARLSSTPRSAGDATIR